MCIFHPWPKETLGFSRAETPKPTKHSHVTLSPLSETHRVRWCLHFEQV